MEPSEARYALRPTDPDAARELGRALDLGPAMSQVLLHRGFAEAAAAGEFLSPVLAGLTPPQSMADRDAAAERLAGAIGSRQRIVVFGDYDVDGTTSAAIVGDVLEALGGDVRTLVANRFDGGYGFSDRALARAIDAGAELIVTCDCGSSDHARISAAKARGLDVIVVDHHLVPKEKLDAVAFLNPHRPECGFAYKGMSSAGLALSIGAAVRERIGKELDLRPWLDLVALGTVADVAPLDGDNRRLVRAGLDRLMKAKRPGIAALREVAHVTSPIGAADIAFRLAPRLNAAGRLGDPSITLELLRTRDLGRARELAKAIEAINDERKAIERRITTEATEQVLEVYGPTPSSGIVVFAEGWNRGVVGITAARLVDRFHRPAVVIALEDGSGHGSGRAPDGFPLYDAIAACAAELQKFGGHQAAAGLTLDRSRAERFRAAFADASRALQGEFGPAPVPIADVCLDGVVFPVPVPRDLWRIEPLGESNPEPLFAIENARIEQAQAVGENGAHLKLRLRVGREVVPAFGYDLGYLAPEIGETAGVLGYVRFDHYRGGRTVEIRIRDVILAAKVAHAQPDRIEGRESLVPVT
jgi:single-stranded-DNA-specific exonuclease